MRRAYLLLPWALPARHFCWDHAQLCRLTHKKMGGKLELGGPVVLFCLVVAGGFQPTEAKVDELGRFDVLVAAIDRSEIRLRIYAGQQLVYDDLRRLPGPVNLALHR